MENVTIKCNQGNIVIGAPDSDREAELFIYGNDDHYDMSASVYIDKARAEKIILALKERFGL